MTTKPELKPCPFCGGKPKHKQAKTVYCQLHGEPSAYVEIYCDNQCPARPKVAAGNCYDLGKYHAALEAAAAKWNTRDDGGKND